MLPKDIYVYGKKIAGSTASRDGIRKKTRFLNKFLPPAYWLKMDLKSSSAKEKNTKMKNKLSRLWQRLPSEVAGNE